MIYLNNGFGMMLTVQTSWPTFATSIFHSTAAHAGLTLQLPHSVTELRLQETLPGPTSTLLPKSLSAASTTHLVAMVEMPSLPMSSCQSTKWLMRPAQSTLVVVLTMANSALLWSSAETALQEKLASSLMSTTSTKLKSSVKSLARRLVGAPSLLCFILLPLLS